MAEFVTELSVFARRLAEARRRLRVSQKQLGILAGLEPHVASPRINQYEKGTHEPRSDFAQRLASALHVPLAYFYTDDDLLAELLLRWPSLTSAQRRTILDLVDGFGAR